MTNQRCPRKITRVLHNPYDQGQDKNLGNENKKRPHPAEQGIGDKIRDNDIGDHGNHRFTDTGHQCLDAVHGRRGPCEN